MDTQSIRIREIEKDTVRKLKIEALKRNQSLEGLIKTILSKAIHKDGKK